MSDERGYRSVAERGDQSHRVPDVVEQSEGLEVAVVGTVPSGGTPVAPQIRRNDVIPGGRDRQYHLAPAICELRKAVQKYDSRLVSRLESCFEDVHSQAVDVVDKPRADARRENARSERHGG